MSANNQILIVKVDGKYNVYENPCVDNPFNWKKEKPIARQPTLDGAIKVAEKQHAEYGYSVLMR